MNLTVFHLITIFFLQDGGYTESVVRQFPDLQACKQAEAATHDAAERSVNLIDVGTICVQSEFKDSTKPRA